MPTAVIDSIDTRFEIVGRGEPLLMFSPGGFDATLDKWRTQGIYAQLQLLDHLAARYSCIVFDRRETGASGGRVERITWEHYVRQGAGLLTHLGIERAHVMGGCMGVCPVALFGVLHPERTRSMALFWPVGGPKYRLSSHLRFAEHLAFVKQHGLAAVVELARSSQDSFGKDPRGGPWVSVLRRDAAFASGYLAQDVARYRLIVEGMARTLFDRDTAPGAEPEDLMCLDVPALIVPGCDDTHAPSAARYLQECLPQPQYWDVPVVQQTAENVPQKILAFLDAHR